MPFQISVIASKMGWTSAPFRALDFLCRAEPFFKRWHSFDEWENRRTGRAEHFVTGSGGFALAIHQMFLAQTQPEEWTLFSGIPADWTDVGFRRLGTSAGWTVSANLAEGRFVRVNASLVGEMAEEKFRLLVPENYEVLSSTTDSMERSSDGRFWILIWVRSEVSVTRDN